jgi:hypothetical protein
MTSGERCDFLHHALLPAPRPTPAVRPALRPKGARTAGTAKRSSLAHRRGGEPRPGLAGLAGLLLLAAGAAVSCYLVPWLAAGGLDDAGFSLNAIKSSLMFRDTSAKAPPARKRPAPQKDLDRQHSDEQVPAPAPPAPTPEPTPAPPVPEVPAPLPDLDTLPAPVVPPEPVQLAGASAPAEAACSDPCVSPRGVSPMLRNWRTFVLPSFVVAALVTQPAAAGEAPPAKDRLKPIQDQLEALKRSLEKSFRDVGEDMTELRKQVNGLREERKTLELSLQTQIADLKTELNALKKRLPSGAALYPAADKGALEEIRSKLAQMEHTLERLQSPPPRVALSPAAQTGRVLLVNTYPSQMLFIVNGQSHRVAPGATLALENLPAGSVSYEAIAEGWGPVRRSTTNLAANETLTLVAR